MDLAVTAGIGNGIVIFIVIFVLLTVAHVVLAAYSLEMMMGLTLEKQSKGEMRLRGK
jgi:hypothetical protein